jgi:hypothetical protein
MIDVLHAVAACEGLIHYWDVAKQPGGTVLLRASSVRFFASEEEAVRNAHGIAERISPPGYDAHTVSAGARTDGVVSEGWHAFVEVLIGAQVGTGTR